MTQAAINLKSFFAENYNKAHTQLNALADMAQTKWQDSPSKERLDELAANLPLKELLERAKSSDKKLLADFLTQLGLARVEQVVALEARLDAMDEKLEALSKKKSAPRRAAKKAAPKKAAPKHAAPQTTAVKAETVEATTTEKPSAEV